MLGAFYVMIIIGIGICIHSKHWIGLWKNSVILKRIPQGLFFQISRHNLPKTGRIWFGRCQNFLSILAPKPQTLLKCPSWNCWGPVEAMNFLQSGFIKTAWAPQLYLLQSVPKTCHGLWLLQRSANEVWVIKSCFNQFVFQRIMLRAILMLQGCQHATNN